MTRIKNKKEIIPRKELTQEDILDFISSLQEYNTEREKPLEYYGKPANQEKYPQMVVNEVLGEAPWFVIQYCEDNSILIKKGKWYICGIRGEYQSQIGTYKWDVSRFNNFIEKWKAVKEFYIQKFYEMKVKPATIFSELVKKSEEIDVNQLF